VQPAPYGSDSGEQKLINGVAFATCALFAAVVFEALPLYRHRQQDWLHRKIICLQEPALLALAAPEDKIKLKG
jgi:hypothetical protein